MNAKKRDVRSGYLTIALFILAAALLIFSTAGSSRAALTYFSETYGAEVSMLDIGVSLVENGKTVSSRDYDTERLGDNWLGNPEGVLLSTMLGTPAGKLTLDQPYEERLTVLNSGTIDEYVRVSIYRYWVDANGNKLTNLSPSLIDLNILSDNGNGWTRDWGSETTERTVLYYQNVLPGGATSPDFADTLTIRQSNDMELGMRAKVSTTETVDPATGRLIITTTYDYDGVEFVLRVDVDAVQTHNSAAAIQSAWGINMADFGIAVYD